MHHTPQHGRRRLLCIYPWMALGGADTFNLDMLDQLGRRGWSATVATTLPGPHPWRAAFERRSDALVDLSAGAPEALPARAVALLAAHAPDCVLVSHSHIGYRLLPYLRAHAPRTAFVDYCHIAEGDGNYVRASLEQAAALDRQIVSSQQLRSWMCARGGDPDRIAVCTTNVDTDRWDPARFDREQLRAALEIAPDVPVVLYAARLERQKQPLLALEIMRRVLRHAPETVFLIAGAGRFGGYLRGVVRRHGLERQIRLLGAVDSARVGELLSISDIFFLPSELEGVSLAIYEAMAMAVVPLSAAVGGQAELVSPGCGVLIERGPREGERYTAALLELIGDRERLRAMGAAARARVAAQFPLAAMGQRMDELLEQARAARRDDPRPPVGAATALASARVGVTQARREWAALAGKRPASRLGAAYWHLLNGPGWPLLPLAERLRATVRR
ncbi:MAG TPA: glycosyltransferase family 4 protein [Roseiflexaceae bacterium]|nr:glycosyltransferase family 4 protein [Roseiflexaceae bacterium]